MNDIDVEAIRKRVIERRKLRQDFYIHLLFFIPFNVFFWFLWIGGGSNGFPWPLVVTLAWGLGVVSHAMDVYYKTSDRATRSEDEEVQREIEKERMRLYGSADLEKPKRGVARLSDDGEIVYENESEAQTVKKTHNEG